MNLVFIGASRFGLRCLETCIKIPVVRIVGIVTAPEIFSISYRPSGVINVLHTDMTSFARQWNLPVAILQRSMNEDGLVKKVAAWKPDAFMVAGWYHMIPKCWRAMAPAYGLHASLLPAYSGGAPLVWAMINGEEKTGITLFQMDDGVDSGPIAGQKEELILPTDTIATLYARIEERGLELLRELLPRIAEGTIELRPQDESKRRVFPQRSPEDGLIDWKKEAEYIDRFIRSQTKPYPGAFTTLESKILHIWSAEPVSLANDNLETGKVHRTQNGSYLAACGAGAISIGWVTYEQKTYSKSQLYELFAQGRQRLGE